MTTSQTSAAFAFWRQLRTTLAAATWPAHPTDGGTPSVMVGDIATRLPDGAREVVAVVGLADLNQEWAAIGQRKRDESFAVTVLVITDVPGVTDDGVLDRLEELVAVIEHAIRPTTTSTEAQITLAVTNVWQSSLASYDAEVFANDQGGHTGRATAIVAVRARI